MLPPVFVLVLEIALVEHPVFHELVVEDIADYVGGVDAQVSDDMVSEKDVVYQGREDVLALVGNPPRFLRRGAVRHDTIKLPAVVAHIIERLAILIFRIAQG